jgi:hypothetical protein
MCHVHCGINVVKKPAVFQPQFWSFPLPSFSNVTKCVEFLLHCLTSKNDFIMHQAQIIEKENKEDGLHIPSVALWFLGAFTKL